MVAATIPKPTQTLLQELEWYTRRSYAPRIRGHRDFTESELVIPEGRFRGSKFRRSTQPFAALLLDELDSGRWRRAAVTGCVQAGKSLMAFVTPVIYHLFEHREPVIVAAPTMDICGDKWAKEILPAIQSSRYARYLPRTGPGSQGGFAEEISFRNGALIKFMSSGGSDAKRSSFTARVLVATEVDKMDTAGAASREADPITQLEARTFSYPEEERRVYLECTVSIPEGRIWQEYQAGSQGRIVCPCPFCGGWVTPEREHLAGWRQAANEVEAERSAYFACPSCGDAVTPADRVAMNRAAKLVHRGQTIEPDGTIHGELPETYTLGFRWNAFNNLFWSPGGIGAAEWKGLNEEEEAADEPSEKKLSQFFWVQPYTSPEFDLEPLDSKKVRKRFAPDRITKGVVPATAAVVTLGCDLRKRYGHWLAVAWRPGFSGVVIDYSTFEVPSAGMALERAIVAALVEFRDSVVFPGWWNTEGVNVVPRLSLVDAGYESDAVYAFCRDPETGIRFRPALGRGQSQHDKRMRNYRRPTKLGAEVKVIGPDYHVGWVPKERLFRVESSADAWKMFAQERLRTSTELPGALELYHSNDRNEHVALSKHFAAERPRQEFVPGKGTQLVWEVLSRTNHWLDCLYMACVAAHLCGVRVLTEASPAAAPEAVEKPKGLLTPDGRPYLITEREG